MSPTYGLDLSTMRTRTKDYANLNNVSGADTKVDRAINDAMRKLVAQRRWMNLRRQGSITPVDGQQSYSLASDFNYPVRCYYISNGIEQPIEIVGEDIWAERSDNDSKGTPYIAAFLDISGTTKLYLSLLPSASFVALYNTVFYDYDKKPDELSSDSDVPEIPNTNSQMALVYMAVAELILKQGDTKGSLAYEAKAQKELDTFFKNDIHFTKGLKRKTGRPMFGVLDGVTHNRMLQDYREGRSSQ